MGRKPESVGVIMTRQEFYEKYGNVKVKFSSYYKFTFTYTATLVNGDRITVDYGGNADEIYRHGLSFDSEETINNLQPYAGYVSHDGIEFEGFHDY